MDTCTKHAYANERSARRKLREIKRKRASRWHQGKVEKRAYHCQWCGKWHLTALPYED